MKRSRLIVIIIVLIGAFLLFNEYKNRQNSAPDVTPKPRVPVLAGTTSAKPDQQDAPSKDPNDPNRPGKPFDGKGRGPRPGERGFAGDANDMEALNLKDVQIKDVIKKLSEWTGKVLIVSDEAMEQKLTIYSSKAVPREQALSLIYSALKQKGFVAEHTDYAIYIKPLLDAKLGTVPVIDADTPLATLENKNQIVQKFFRLKSYSPTQISNIILPMIGEYGYVTADENASMLIIIETVENLIRFESIIKQFDVPEAEMLTSDYFQLEYADPAEVVQLLDMLLTGRKSSSKSSSSSYRNEPPRARTTGKVGEMAVSVLIESTTIPILLIPDQKRKWVIVKGMPDDIKMIGDWIEKLDTQEHVVAESETIPIDYADVREVASQLNDALQEMPGSEFRTSVLIQPLTQARQIMVFGRPEIRQLVKDLVMEIDVPTGEFITRLFDLKHADPEQLKANLDELFGDPAGSDPRDSYYYYRYNPSAQQRKPEDTVKVIAFSTMMQITVIASEENMEKIAAQIAEWDVPIDVDQVKPRIIELHNSDPVKMAELLTNLFTEQSSGGRSFFDLYFGRGEDKKKIVGPLYGQLTFESVPDTKKIIVISNIPEAYGVIEDLVKELDSMEVAELPIVITLKYADAEDLCEQLNAILNEAGTVSTVRRSSRGLSESSTDETGQYQSGAGQDDSGDAGQISPWWDKSRPRPGEEMPTSNLIGRIRFIPVHRSKAILVLAPVEYQQSIRDMIEELDQPGKQVMIKVAIIDINHEKLLDLGAKLSSNPSALGTVGTNALLALTQLNYTQNQGIFTVDKTEFQKGATTSININTLVDFLAQEADARVLIEPTLWTKDNEEADFFRGGLIPFIVSSTLSQETTATKDSVEYRPVGVTLRVRPNITPEKAVDLTINLIISQLAPTLVNGNIATDELNTTTHMIVEDGETIMLGGILDTTDSKTVEKIPFLGDLPFIGGLFRNTSTELSNNELIVFITPYVMDDQSTPEAINQLKDATDKLDDLKQHFKEALEQEEKKKNKKS